VYSGHYAVGLALFAAQPRRDRGTLALVLGASIAADVLWTTLTIAGLEGGHSMGSQAYHQPRLPWSHSVVSTLVLAAALAALAFALARRRGDARPGVLAAVSGGAVVAHWLTDAPVAEGFDLLPGRVPIALPHLYGRVGVAFAFELGLIVLGFLPYARAMPGTARARTFGVLATMVGLHLLIFGPSFADAPATDLDAHPLAVTPYLVLLGGQWAALIVIHRAPVATRGS
jgi:hypothetical protein